MQLITDLDESKAALLQLDSALSISTPSQSAADLLVAGGIPSKWIDEWRSFPGVFSLEAWEDGQLLGTALFRILRGHGTATWTETPIRGLECNLAGGSYDASGLLLLDVMGIAVEKPYEHGRGRQLRHGLECIMRAQPLEHVKRLWMFARASSKKSPGERHSARDWWLKTFEGAPTAVAFQDAGAFGEKLATVLTKCVVPHMENHSEVRYRRWPRKNQPQTSRAIHSTQTR